VLATDDYAFFYLVDPLKQPFFGFGAFGGSVKLKYLAYWDECHIFYLL
jgi:hypothetical protein